MPHRSFDVPEVVDDDPISFDLAGRKVRCLPEVPVGLRLRIGFSGRLSRQELMDFVRGVVVPDDEAAYDEALNDKRLIVSSALIEEVFWYLIECYLERTGEAVAVRVPQGEDAVEQGGEEGEASEASDGSAGAGNEG